MINRECFLKQFKKYNGDTIRLWLTSDDIMIIPDTLEEDPYFFNGTLVLHFINGTVGLVDWKKVESVEFLEHEVYPTVEPEEILNDN